MAAQSSFWTDEQGEARELWPMQKVIRGLGHAPAVHRCGLAGTAQDLPVALQPTGHARFRWRPYLAVIKQTKIGH